MKKNKLNYFQAMDQKKQAEGQASTISKQKVKESTYKAAKAPILDVKLSPSEEENHYKACLDYCLKMSSKGSQGRIQVHMDMNKKLHFNMPQDEHFKDLWQSKKLLCLIDLPQDWKTMPIEALDEEDAEDYDLNDPLERFDYLYETGMSYCED